MSGFIVADILVYGTLLWDGSNRRLALNLRRGLSGKQARGAVSAYVAHCCADPSSLAKADLRRTVVNRDTMT